MGKWDWVYFVLYMAVAIKCAYVIIESKVLFYGPVLQKGRVRAFIVLCLCLGTAFINIGIQDWLKT